MDTTEKFDLITLIILMSIAIMAIFILGIIYNNHIEEKDNVVGVRFESVEIDGHSYLIKHNPNCNYKKEK